LLHKYASIESKIIEACSINGNMRVPLKGYEKPFKLATQSLDIIADIAKVAEKIKLFRHKQ